MRKYQILETLESDWRAGSKAVSDVSEIAKARGYYLIKMKLPNGGMSIFNRIRRQMIYFWDWLNAYRSVQSNSIMLLQHPFRYKQFGREYVLNKLKKKKNVKIISVVHDVEELRTDKRERYAKHEFDVMIQVADKLIVHNEKMQEFFLNKGVDKTKLINLQIFDYLQESNENVVPRFAKAISIAGNLDTEKSGYISQLGRVKGIHINLYGPNYDNQLNNCKNIKYNGCFPAEVIPYKLNSGFGLVWDGKSVDVCVGGFGEYLKYNNPHKLSLYISSGIPVVIWKKAAEASFVEKKGIGICVESLLELESVFSVMTENDYHEMVKNVRKISSKLQSGFYMSKALETAEDLACKVEIK